MRMLFYFSESRHKKRRGDASPFCAGSGHGRGSAADPAAGEERLPVVGELFFRFRVVARFPEERHSFVDVFGAAFAVAVEPAQEVEAVGAVPVDALEVGPGGGVVLRGAEAEGAAVAEEVRALILPRQFVTFLEKAERFFIVLRDALPEVIELGQPGAAGGVLNVGGADAALVIGGGAGFVLRAAETVFIGLLLPARRCRDRRRRNTGSRESPAPRRGGRARALSPGGAGRDLFRCRSRGG